MGRGRVINRDQVELLGTIPAFKYGAECGRRGLKKLLVFNVRFDRMGLVRKAVMKKEDRIKNPCIFLSPVGRVT